LRSDHELNSVSDWESSILGLMVLDLNHLDLGDGPGLVLTIVASMESGWLVVVVTSLPNIQAEALLVSDVSLAARVEVEDLLLLSFPLSHDSSSVLSEPLSPLVGDDEVSLDSTSHGLGSCVEDPPCSLVLWVGVLNSKSVLSVSHMLVVEELLVATHLRLEQELNSMCDWLNLGFTSFLNDSSDALSLVRSQDTFLQITVELSIDVIINA